MPHGVVRESGMRVFLVAAVLSLSLVLGGCASDAAQGEAAGQAAGNAAGQEAPQANMSVTVFVEAETEGFEAQEVTVDVAEGATVYDALAASGIDIVASDSDYGMYVDSIAGLAGDSSHAWVFTVNGQQVMEACDACVLADGDTVEWSYITW